jgi:hydrogenase/urease accessory protein HupE
MTPSEPISRTRHGSFPFQTIPSLILVAAVGLAALLPSPALAHSLSPAHVRISAAPDGELHVVVRHAEDSRAPDLIPPRTCEARPIAARVDPDGDRILESRWRCTSLAAPLALRAAPGDPPAIVEVPGPTGPRTTLLDASSPTLSLEAALGPAPNAFSRLLRWTLSGAHHLLIGLDHVLLVVGLVLLLGFNRRLVFALTAFTVGHSVSLALGATGTLTLPSAPVETAIALSLVALALSLTHPSSTHARAPFARAPWTVGLLIGLVHGLGFAGVLGELDLPSDGLALPILGFNLGLELAQLALVAALAAVLAPLHRLAPRLAAALPSPAGWAIGIVAAAWTLERIGV